MIEDIRDRLRKVEAAWTSAAREAADEMDTARLHESADALGECKLLAGQLEKVEARVLSLSTTLDALEERLEPGPRSGSPPKRRDGGSADRHLYGNGPSVRVSDLSSRSQRPAFR